MTATVVTTAAATKKIMNTGKAFQKLNFFALLSFFVSFFACIRLKTRVIGIIANVLVNFTVTALSVSYTHLDVYKRQPILIPYIAILVISTIIVMCVTANVADVIISKRGDN